MPPFSPKETTWNSDTPFLCLYYTCTTWLDHHLTDYCVFTIPPSLKYWHGAPLSNVKMAFMCVYMHSVLHLFFWNAQYFRYLKMFKIIPQTNCYFAHGLPNNNIVPFYCLWKKRRWLHYCKMEEHTGWNDRLLPYLLARMTDWYYNYLLAKMTDCNYIFLLAWPTSSMSFC